MGGYHTGTFPAVKPPRKVYMDVLRVIATVFVICVHTVALAKTTAAPGTLLFRVLEVFNYTFLSCNLFFVMISGALLLPVKGERCRDFFARRFIRVFIPLVVYYNLYVCAKEGIGRLAPSQWGLMLQRFFIGPPVEAPHLWLVYVIIWLYVLTPFLRYLVQNIPDPVMNGVMLVIFLLNAYVTYVPLFGVTPPAVLSGIVNSYAGAFLLGYYLANRAGKRAENFFLAAGLLSYLITCCVVLFHGWYDDYIYNNAPTMMFYAAAVFVLIKRLVPSGRKESPVVRIIGKYSYSILLIHWGVLHYAVKQVLHVDVLSGGIVGGCLLAVLLTFALSFVGAVILDQTIIRFLTFAVSKLIDGLRTCFSQKSHIVS